MMPRIRIWLLFSLTILLLANQGCFASLPDNNGSTEEVVASSSLDSHDLLDLDREDEISLGSTVPVADLVTEDVLETIQESVGDSNNATSATSASSSEAVDDTEERPPSLSTSDEEEPTVMVNASNSSILLSEPKEDPAILAESGEIPVDTSPNADVVVEQEPSTPADESEVEDSIVESTIDDAQSDEVVVEAGVDEGDDSIVEPSVDPNAESVAEVTQDEDEDDDSTPAPVTEVDSSDAKSTEEGHLEMDSEAVEKVATEGNGETNIEDDIKQDDEAKIVSDSEIADETSDEQTQTPTEEIDIPDSGNATNEEPPDDSETVEEKAPPKPGSLASFFKQVSDKEKEREAGRSSPESTQEEEDANRGKAIEDALRTSSTMGPASIIGESLTMQNKADRLELTREQDPVIASNMEHQEDLTTPSEVPKSGEDSEEEDRAYGYTAVWGRQAKHTANKHLLYEVAQKNAAKGTSQSADESIHDEDSDTRAASPETDDNDAASREAAKEKDSIPLPKSVNTQFVEGLDDINKFLEEVEPPDELDVGAAGSSLQEVLIGQGAQILLKRVTIIFSRVKQSFGATRIKQFFASRRTPDGEFSLFTREELERAGKRLWKGCKSAAGKVHEAWEDFFDDDDDSLQFEVEATKLDSIRHRLLDEKRHSPSDRRGSERQFAGATSKGEAD